MIFNVYLTHSWPMFGTRRIMLLGTFLVQSTHLLSGGPRLARMWLILDLTRNRSLDSENQGTIDNSLWWRSIAWMATTLRELELLSPLLNVKSTLPASRLSYWAAAFVFFHLTTALFSRLHTSHIPCHFHWVCHSAPTLFLFGFLFHFYH